MLDQKTYDVIIVGGGMSGLTSAAYLSKYGYKTLILEKQDVVGGLVHSFNYNNFVLDGGIRSIESSGVVIPMLKDLDIPLELSRSHVTLGIKDQVIPLFSIEDIPVYQRLLIDQFPEEEKAIVKIFKRIHMILKYMDVLYGIDNPMIVDLKKHPSYVYKTLLPWFFRFVPTLFKIERLNLPVEHYLKRFTQHQPLIDLIAQHFFKDTPTFFALGYFSIYFDYRYPKGGTGSLPKALENYIMTHGGTIQLNTKIVQTNVDKRQLTDDQGNIYNYHKLIWASDYKQLYNSIDTQSIERQKLAQHVKKHQTLIASKKGAESVLSIYAMVDLDPSYFHEISTGHFFYTPSAQGLSGFPLLCTETLNEMMPSLTAHLDHQTYEISIPALRDSSLAPKGQTALIISILMDYDIINKIEFYGYYEAFKTFVTNYIIELMSRSIYPSLQSHLLEAFCSTPLTFEKRNGSSEGAIIGWSFQNKPIPVKHRMFQITKSIHTKLPNIYIAGQWSFSPAGVPISVITGKLAADKIHKKLKKKRFKGGIYA